MSKGEELRRKTAWKSFYRPEGRKGKKRHFQLAHGGRRVHLPSIEFERIALSFFQKGRVPPYPQVRTKEGVLRRKNPAFPLARAGRRPAFSLARNGKKETPVFNVLVDVGDEGTAVVAIPKGGKRGKIFLWSRVTEKNPRDWKRDAVPRYRTGLRRKLNRGDGEGRLSSPGHLKRSRRGNLFYVEKGNLPPDLVPGRERGDVVSVLLEEAQKHLHANPLRPPGIRGKGKGEIASRRESSIKRSFGASVTVGEGGRGKTHSSPSWDEIVVRWTVGGEERGSHFLRKSLLKDRADASAKKEKGGHYQTRDRAISLRRGRKKKNCLHTTEGARGRKALSSPWFIKKKEGGRKIYPIILTRGGTGGEKQWPHSWRVGEKGKKGPRSFRCLTELSAS